MGKRMVFDDEARQALRRGMDQLADAVRVTLGPRGRNVVLSRGEGPPMITNDGVTIAKQIELADPFENMGAQLTREVSAKTQAVAGDGTTTAIVLTQALVTQGLRAVAAGARPMALKRAMDRAGAEVLERLAARAQPVGGLDELRRVAALAAGDPFLGDLVAQALERVGPAGMITVDEAPGVETRLSIVEGMRWNEGYLSPYFVTDTDRMEAILENPRILLCGGKLADPQALHPLLSRLAGEKRPLLVVVDDLDPEVLSTLVVNRLRGTLHGVAVNAPEFGDRRREALDDLAVLTGATVLAPDRGRDPATATVEDLGGAARVVVGADATTVIGGGGDLSRIHDRVAALREQLGTEGDSEALRLRLGRLTDGVAVVSVGGDSAIDRDLARSRVEDAVAASRAAMQGGVLVGGGVALLVSGRTERSPGTPEERLGARVLALSLDAPVRWIAFNAGADGAGVVERVRAAGGSVGYNAVSNQLEDLERARVLDPARVVATGLRNALSIAGMILTTETLVADGP